MTSAASACWNFAKDVREERGYTNPSPLIMFLSIGNCVARELNKGLDCPVLPGGIDHLESEITKLANAQSGAISLADLLNHGVGVCRHRCILVLCVIAVLTKLASSGSGRARRAETNKLRKLREEMGLCMVQGVIEKKRIVLLVLESVTHTCGCSWAVFW